MNKNSKKIISSLVIIGILAMPFSNFIPKANAFTANSGATVGGGGLSATGYVHGLLPTIVKLPGCQAMGASFISGLFSGNALSTNIAMSPAETQEFKKEVSLGLQVLGISLGEKAAEKAAGVEAQATNDAALNTKVDNLNKQVASLVGYTKSQLQTTKSMNKNDNCLNAIGKTIVKMLIQKLTLSIIDWINGVNSDGPLFVTNPSKFFKDIAENEILDFGGEISGVGPFAKSFLMNAAASFNNKFAANAQYSLNEMIAQTNPDCRDKNGRQINCDVAFNADFSMGGWGAWDALTQYPQNNPLGFQLMASNELGKRLDGTVNSVADLAKAELQQASGFLSQEYCASPLGITREEDAAARSGDNTMRKCNEWKISTPGNFIAETATTALGYNNHALLDASTLNDAIAAILDAAMARFSSKLINKGIASLSDNNDMSSSSDQIDLGEYFAPTGASQVSTDFASSYMTPWLSNNPDFNIRTDVTQALVDEQKTYMQKLEQQNKELMSKTFDEKSYGLMPAIYQLDYCIPGPHPGWEEDSRQILNIAENTIVDKTEDDMKDMSVTEVTNVAASAMPMAGAAIGAAIGSIVPGLGTAIGTGVGVVVGLLIPVITVWATGAGKKLVLLYGNIFRSLTGIKTNDYKNANVPTSKDNIIKILDAIFERYIDAVHNIYSLHMPTVTDEATSEFNKLEGYDQMIKDNNLEISSVKNTIARLEAIKTDIDTLNSDTTLDQTQYETKLQIEITSFAKVSSKLVSGDEIADADSMLKQIVDEKNYIYNVLLKGPHGCEQDLEHGDAANLPSEIFDTQRMTYPAPILYNYPLGRKALIPDPWNSGYINHMTDTPIGAEGPGFLSYFQFENGSDWCGSIGPMCIKVHDLVDLAQWSTTVGKSKGGANCKDGMFESIIGIY